MLVYEKKVLEVVDDEEKLVRHLFGTMGNVPSEEDAQLIYRELDGDDIEIVDGDKYFDDKHHGIIRESDGKSMAVYIDDEEQGEVNIIPGGDFEPEPTDVESIEITTLPTKVKYTEGQTLDLTGIVVTATYLDGDTREVTDFTSTPANGDRLERTNTTITVEFGGQEATFEVTVAEAVLTALEWTKAPVKTEYKDGEIFDLAGGIVDGEFSTADGEFIEKRNMSDSVNYKLMESGSVITKDEASTVAVTMADVKCVAFLNDLEADQEITVTETTEKALEAMLAYEYSPKYTYKGTATVSDDVVDYTVATADVGENFKNVMNDFARYLGALYRANEAVPEITFGGVTYTWNPAGTLKGSNYEAEDGTTLVSAVTDVMASQIATGSATFAMTILGEEVTFNVAITE